MAIFEPLISFHGGPAYPLRRLLVGVALTVLLAVPGTLLAEDWRDTFRTELPAGWSVAERTFRDPPASRALLANSADGTYVLIAFFDGSPIKDGLATNTLETLLRAYLDGFSQTRGTPIQSRAPWSCKLDVPRPAPLRGERVVVELPDGRERVLHACAARDEARGALVVVVVWQQALEPQEGEEIPPEALELMAQTGFL